MSDIFSIQATTEQSPSDIQTVYQGIVVKWDDSVDDWVDAGLGTDVFLTWMGDVNNRYNVPEDVDDASKVLLYNCRWTNPPKTPPHKIEIDLTDVGEMRFSHCIITDIIQEDNKPVKPSNMKMDEEGIIFDATQYTGRCILFVLELNYIILKEDMVGKFRLTIPNHHNVLGVFDSNNELLEYGWDVSYSAEDTILRYQDHRDVPQEGFVALAPRVECTVNPRFRVPRKHVGIVHFDIAVPVQLYNHVDNRWMETKYYLDEGLTEMEFYDQFKARVANILVPHWFYHFPHEYKDWKPVKTEQTSHSPFTYVNNRNYICADDSGGPQAPAVGGNYLGVFNDYAALIAAYPTADPWDYATVLSTNTKWEWNPALDQWTDTSIATSVWKYDDNGDIAPVDPTRDIVLADNRTVDGRDISEDGTALDDHIGNDAIHSQWYHQHITFTGSHITSKSVFLDNTPKNTEDIIFQLEKGGEVILTIDYTVTGSTLSWSGLGLDGVLRVGDKGLIKYLV